MLPELETFTLEYLENQRSEVATRIGAQVMGQVLPDGAEGVDDIVAYTDQMLGAFAPGVASRVRKTLTLPIFLLQRPKRLSFRYGNTVLVREAARHDLVEVLTRLHAYLGRDDIRLVKQGITLTNACNNYRWLGTAFEFYLGNIFTVKERGMQPEYVAYVPDRNYQPKSSLDVKIVRVEHKQR
ncbi:MAG: hypothetical protein VYA55_07805 [Pseudomonadota bacterium]|nr:hypothetical protein [Pseudomonadota bacterium]